MAFLDHEGAAEYEFPREVVLDALVKAVGAVPGMTIDTVDKAAGRVLIKAGMSLMSWGENIPIQVSSSANNRSRVAITSTPKTGALFGGAFDLGKNRKNIERILAALSHQLASVQPSHPSTGGGGSADTVEVEARLLKLKKLLESGAISRDDYERKKSAILDEV